MRKLVEMLSATDPAKLEAFRREYEAARRVTIIQDNVASPALLDDTRDEDLNMKKR